LKLVPHFLKINFYSFNLSRIWMVGRWLQGDGIKLEKCKLIGVLARHKSIKLVKKHWIGR